MKHIKIFLYAFLLIFLALNSCKKKDDPKPNSNGGGGGGGSSSFGKLQVLVDGTLYTAKVDSAGTEWATMSTGTTSVELTSSLTDQGSINGVIDVVKGELAPAGAHPTNQELKNFFAAGSYNFDSNVPRNGIAIRFYDDNNLIWDTDGGDQTGSTFTITEVTDTTDPFFGYMVKIKATFNCKVYNGGNSKTLTNGVYWGYYAVY